MFEAIHSRTPFVLGIFGLLPFLGLCIISWLPLGQPIPTASWFVSYSAIILSFMAGSLWGLSLNAKVKNAKGLLIASNVFALMAWVAILNTSYFAALALLALGYLLTLSKEDLVRSYLSRAYWRLRLWLTYTVLATHVLMKIHVLTH